MSSPLRPASHLFSRLVGARSAFGCRRAVLGDELKQVGRDPADVIRPGQGIAQRPMHSVDLDDLVSAQACRCQPCVDDSGTVGGAHPERVADRITDLIFGDVKT
jgi:hypothetical protein